MEYSIFYPYKGMKSNFLNSFLAGIPGGDAKDGPIGKQFSKCDPTGKLALTGMISLEILLWKDNFSPCVPCFWHTPREFPYPWYG